jgi:energy-coupling factor transporter ATP-binding protein EcfA2
VHIENVVIKNFRAIEELHFDLNSRVNVIVGPNAVGKTTVLQAIRLLKALVAPRSSAEAQQTLMSLGAASPHFPQRLHLPALARDLSRPVDIQCTYRLSDEEIQLVVDGGAEVIRSAVQAGIGQTFANPAALIQFMSSAAGATAIQHAEIAFKPAFNLLARDKRIIIGILIDPKGSPMKVLDACSGPILQFLEARLPPHLTLFSYFPADRALPTGEVVVQLGAHDVQQQIESHNSQPQLKYQRLKSTIFNNIVMNEGNRRLLLEEF